MRISISQTALIIAAGSLWLFSSMQSSETGRGSKGESVIDPNKMMGIYTGAGIGIHGGDVVFSKAFDELKPQYVRMEFGPRWDKLEEKIPSGGTVKDYVAYLERNYNGDADDRLEGAQFTHDFLRERGTEIIKIHFDLPYHWRGGEDSNQFLSKHIEDFARFNTAHLVYLRKHGVLVDYIELANEPDGDWNGRIEPDDYARLVKLSDELLEKHGFGEVKLLGPGLTFLTLHDLAPPYFDALEKVGVHHLDGWSTHIWDEVEFNASLPEFTYGIWKPFLERTKELDPKRKMPIFVTEYSSDVTEFDGVQRPSPRDQITDTVVDTWPHAVRVIANSITNLNRGANALVLYRLTNTHWHKTGWGMVQPISETEFQPKPVYGAVVMALSTLPVGSEILKPIWYTHNDPITLSCLHDKKKKSIEIVAANSTTKAEKKTISVAQEMNGFSIKKVVIMDESGKADIKPAKILDGKLCLEMPPLTIARITLCYQSDPLKTEKP